MFWILLVVSIITGSDLSKLAHEDWRIREGAEWRLRLYGLIALPVVWDARHDPDPERRARVERLIVPWVSYNDDLRAASILLSPWPVDSIEFWRNENIRRRIQRLARAAGVSQVITDDLTPSVHQAWWVWQVPTHLVAASALDRCRYYLSITPVGWPFR